MNFNELIKRKSGWLKGEGPKSDIVMSTRVRLARNINGYPFFNWSSDDKREEVFERIVDAVKKSEATKDASVIRLKEASPLELLFLIERHLISNEHARQVDFRGLALADDEMMSIMINEEDHVRIQVIQSGFNIAESWNIVDRIDTKLNEKVPFAYSNKFGYLTACPTNTGTGLRASVMMHLPALEMTGQIENVYEAISKLGMTIRGFYGEGTEASGNFFQISNQVALGHSEMDIIDNFGRVIEKIIAREQETRVYLIKRKEREISDNIFRSYGTLKSSRIITSRETIKLLSSVRLGVDLGLIRDIDVSILNEILMYMQPAHLQMLNKKPLAQDERDIKRSDLIREKLGGEK